MPYEEIIKTLFIFLVAVAGLTPILTWIERKQSAVMQDRIGANRADVAGITILGLFHPIADVVKLLTKEDVVPQGANRALHMLAPRNNTVMSRSDRRISVSVLQRAIQVTWPNSTPRTRADANGTSSRRPTNAR